MVYITAIFLGFYVWPELLSSYSWMPFLAEFLVVAPFATYNWWKQTEPDNSYESNTPQALLLMGYTILAFFTSMTIFFEGYQARLWQTEYSLIPAEYEAVTNADQVHKASQYVIPEGYQRDTPYERAQRGEEEEEEPVQSLFTF